MATTLAYVYEQMTHALWVSNFQQTAVAQLQTSVLVSFDGVLDRYSGRAICLRVRNLLELCVEPIFIDLSGVEAVNDAGACHLTEMLQYADAVGGGIAILDTSEAIDAYLLAVKARHFTKREGQRLVTEPYRHTRRA